MSKVSSLIEPHAYGKKMAVEIRQPHPTDERAKNMIRAYHLNGPYLSAVVDEVPAGARYKDIWWIAYSSALKTVRFLEPVVEKEAVES